MKLKLITAFILFIVLVSITIDTGCKKSSSDNNNPVGPGTTNNSIVGTWTLSKITVLGENNSQQVITPQQAGLAITFVFRSDNTAQVTESDSAATSTDKGTYTFANNVLTLKDSTGQTKTFQLTFTSNNVFTMPLPININGTDYNSILEFTKQPGIRWD